MATSRAPNPGAAAAGAVAGGEEAAGPKVSSESLLALKRRARRINKALAEKYPYAHAELDFRSPFELLVATVLSAQTTDVTVNQITPILFARYPDARSMAEADPAELEAIIKPTGFFRAKTRSLIALGTRLVDEYNGVVPGRLEDLVTLPGVRAQNGQRGAGQRLRHPGDHR
ncbi:endonuclease III [Arthrobacter pascens]|nr:endonuclease III [Arthrobacter pascens]